PMVPCVCAPHQSSGTGGTTAAASSFLTSRLPTCGPLPWVSSTWCPAATTAATRTIARSIAARRSSGPAPPARAGPALPPPALPLGRRCPARHRRESPKRRHQLRGRSAAVQVVQPGAHRLVVLPERRRGLVGNPPAVGEPQRRAGQGDRAERRVLDVQQQALR